MVQDDNYVLETFFKEIAGIANKEYQQRVWTQGAGPECDDFDESVCRYSQFADFIFEDPIKYEIRDKKLVLIQNFHEEFKNFWEKNDLPQLFIDSPEWNRIVLLAQNILDEFNFNHDLHEF